MCTDVASYRWEGPNRKQDQGNWKFAALNVIPETFRETEREKERERLEVSKPV